MSKINNIALVRFSFLIILLISFTTGCTKQGQSNILATTVISDFADSGYSLNYSTDRTNWVLVYADKNNFTLNLVTGSFEIDSPIIFSTEIIDQIDVPPGINPNFGSHTFFEYRDIQYLFYSDQELAHSRVTKWIYRTSSDPYLWTVDLLDKPVIPLATLQNSKESIVFAESEDSREISILKVSSERSSPVITQIVPEIDYGKILSSFSCNNNTVLISIREDNLFLIDETNTLIPLPPYATQPISIGCTKLNQLVAYVKSDPVMSKTSLGSTLNASIIVAQDLNNKFSTEVTLAREVSSIAIFHFKNPDNINSPNLYIIYTELITDKNKIESHHLAIIKPDNNGEYIKTILVSGKEPIQDFLALEQKGILFITFRRNNKLHITQYKLNIFDR